MTDEPDFSDITEEHGGGSSSGSSSSNRTEFKQMHVKGRYGTTTFRNDDGCQVCGKNSDILLLTNYIEGEGGDQWTREIQVCEAHEGDVLGDLHPDTEPVERREF